MQEFRWNLTGFSWRGMKGKNITEGLKERKTDTSQTQQRKGNASRKKLLGSNADQEWRWSWWIGGRPGPWLRLICNCKSVISDESTCILKFQGWKCVCVFFFLTISTYKNAEILSSSYSVITIQMLLKDRVCQPCMTCICLQWKCFSDWFFAKLSTREIYWG